MLNARQLARRTTYTAHTPTCSFSNSMLATTRTLANTACKLLTEAGCFPHLVRQESKALALRDLSHNGAAQTLQNAMTPSEEYTSAERERCRPPHREVTEERAPLPPFRGGGQSNPSVSSSRFSVSNVLPACLDSRGYKRNLLCRHIQPNPTFTCDSNPSTTDQQPTGKSKSKSGVGKSAAVGSICGWS